jgi:hypothetical protein
MLAAEAETEAYAGHLQKARELTRRAIESSLRAERKGGASDWELQDAFREEIFSEPDARSRALEGIMLPPGSPETQAFGAFVLAGSGGSKQAESLAQGFAEALPFPHHCAVPLSASQSVHSWRSRPTSPSRRLISCAWRFL